MFEHVCVPIPVMSACVGSTEPHMLMVYLKQCGSFGCMPPVARSRDGAWEQASFTYVRALA